MAAKLFRKIDSMIFKSSLPLALAILFLSVGLAAQKKAEANDLPGSEKKIEADYKWRITKERLNGVYIPKNLDDMFGALDRQTDEASKAKVRALPEDSVDLRLHLKLGLWMKINWSFYEGSRLGHYLRSAGVSDPEDQASFCIVAWHRHLSGKPTDVRELAESFKQKTKVAHQAQLREGEVIQEETRKKN